MFEFHGMALFSYSLKHFWTLFSDHKMRALHIY